MTTFLIIFGPFLLLHLLSWTPLPDKVPVRRKNLGGKTDAQLYRLQDRRKELLAIIATLDAVDEAAKKERAEGADE